MLPGMLPEDSPVNNELEGKLSARSQGSHGSGSGEVYWWSPLESRPSDPDAAENLDGQDGQSKAASHAATEAVIQ